MMNSLYHLFLALISALVYGFPSRRLSVIGVTGTKGKTTVTEILGKILESGGYKIALANGLRFKIGDTEQPNMLKMTMPGRGKLQRFLRDAVNSGCKYAVIEVTSEGIKQHRHRFIDFTVAALTNLQKEHIEAHGSFEAYREAKADLFRRVKTIHVLNADDPNINFFDRFDAEHKWYFGLKPTNRAGHVIVPESFETGNFGITFTLYGRKFSSRLLGEFNLSNILCAAAISRSLGIEWEAIHKGVAEFAGVPGRLEFIRREPFGVIVDYAHTPDSLEAVYKTVRDSLKPGRMICVLGAAGGGRDKWKRPVMGEIASRYCDEIFLTDEDPYDEPPERIISDIQSGITNYPARGRLRRPSADRQLPITHVILDRKEAIRSAITAAKSGDAVIITGKGAERFMVKAGKKIPWSDREVVEEILNENV